MNKTDIIKSLINKTGLNMKAFSQKAGLPYSTLRSMLERGVENASVNNVIKVCSTLNITIEELYEMEEESSNSISKEEKILLENFKKLNDQGKKEANKRVAELTEINKYTDIISTTNNNVIELKAKQDDEIFIPYKSLDEAGKTIAAHDDDLTDEEKALADKILLDYINNQRLKEFNKQHNK